MREQFYNRKEHDAFLLRIRRVIVLSLLLALSSFAHAQTKTVSGTIKDADGQPLPGATVQIQGTTTGTIADENGGFSLETSEGDILVVSFVGFESQTINVGARSVIDISMVDSSLLSEVVVIGYGETQRKDVTGALSNIESKDFNLGLITTPEQLLTGKLTGVTFTPSGGAPGAQASILVRGVTSISNSSAPLIVVDGFPLDGRSLLPGGLSLDPLGQTPQRNPLSSINANDIASFNVLKDASATAIYGSRGANGVIIITTNRANELEGFFNYRSSVSFSSMLSEYDVLTGDEWRAQNQAYGNDLSEADFGSNTDWLGTILRNSVSHDQYLSFGDATKNGDYSLSLGYTDQQGIILNTSMEKVTARLNTRQDLIDNFLSADLNLQYTLIEDEIAPIGPAQQASGNLITGVLSNNPTIPIYNEDGTLVQRGQTIGGLVVNEDFNSPLAVLNNYEDIAETSRVLGNLALNASFTDNFSGEIRLGIDNSFSSRNSVLDEDYAGRAGSQDLNGVIQVAERRLESQLFEGLLRYNKDYGQSSLNTLVGYSFQNFQSEDFLIAATSTNDLTNIFDIYGWYSFTATSDVPLSAINGVSPRSRISDKSQLQSYFARVQYSYLNKLTVTGTVRYDGSSKFGPDNQYGLFPSFAAGYVLSEESFSPSFFNFLKVRAGWGVTGNQNFASGASVLQQGLVQTGVENGLPVYSNGFPVAANPAIKWEETEQINIGLEFEALSSKLYGTIDYFSKSTSDLIVTNFNPAQQSVFVNLDANVVSSGLEFLIGGTLIDPSSGDFSLDLSANVTKYIKNGEISDYSGAPIPTGNLAIPGVAGGGQPTQQIQNDTRIGEFYLPIYSFDEGNGYSVSESPEHTDKSGLPGLIFGINLNADYKRFDLSANLSGASDFYVLNATVNGFLARERVLNYNISESNIDKFPGDQDTNPTVFSDQLLEQGNHIRLNNVSLGYSLSTNNVKWLKELRVFLSGQNLFILTDYTGQDPQINIGGIGGGVPAFGIDNGVYPSAKTYTIGINANF